MLLRARLCASDARPSSHKIYEVKAENNEVENILAQSYWEMPQANNQLNNPVHLQVITQRRTDPVLVLEFIETGCNFVFQVLHDVAQWCIELAETHALPAGCSLVSHEFVSNKIMPVTGSTFCSLLNLLHMDDIKLPAWITRMPASTNRPPNHVIAVSLKAPPGSPSLAMGHVSMLVSSDTELSEIFRVLRRDWPNFTLRHLGSTELLPAADQKLYSYDLARTQGTRMKDLGLPVGKTWFMPEPLAIEPVPRKLRNRS